MLVKKTIDVVGGIGSILTGLMCLVIGLWDRGEGHSMWKVWMAFCVLLICNGAAMFWHAKHTPGAHGVEDKTLRGHRSHT